MSSSNDTQLLSRRHLWFRDGFIGVFVLLLAVLAIAFCVSWANLSRSHNEAIQKQHIAETRASFWQQALGQKPLENDVVGSFARELRPVVTPDHIQSGPFGAGNVPEAIDKGYSPRGQFAGLSKKLGFKVFIESNGDSGAFTPYFKGLVVRVLTGNGAKTLPAEHRRITEPANPLAFWPVWVALLFGASTVTFLFGLLLYYQVDKQKAGWLNEHEAITYYRPAFEFIDWRERQDRLSKIIVVLLSPQSVIVYSACHRQRPHLIPHRSSRQKPSRDGIATRVYCKLTRKPLPVSKDPKVRFANQREHIEKLRRSLDNLPAAQRNRTSVKAAYDEIGRVASAYDSLPNVVEGHAADVVAAQVVADLQLLKEAPLSYAKAQQEVLEAELARIAESLPALEPKPNKDQQD